MAKSVKKESGLTVTSTAKVDMPEDALGPEAYDEDKSTSYAASGNKKLKVSEEMQGKSIYFTGKFDTVNGNMHYVYFKDGNNQTLKTINYGSYTTLTKAEWLIPEGTVEIQFVATWNNRTIIVDEIEVNNTPVINNTKYYPILTEYGIEQGYNEVTIDYFQTSVQRLYRINEEEWKEYKDKAIRLELDDTIEAKGIDKSGTETYISTYIAVLPSDGLGVEAYDGDESTSYAASGNKKLKVSEEMQGKSIYFTGKFDTVNGNMHYVYFKDGNNQTLKTINYGSYTTLTKAEWLIPEGTVEIQFVATWNNRTIIVDEIEVNNTPVINSIKYYPILSLNSFTNEKYQVKINYISYLPQKLYSVDNGTTWLEYADPFEVNVGDVIKAKAIDEEGNESSITSYTVTAISDSLDSKAFDNDKETSVTIAKSTNKVFTLGEDIIGKDIRFFFSGTISSTATIKIYDSLNNELESISIIDTITVFEVPENAYKVVINSGSSTLTVSEINIREVSISDTNNNPIIELDRADWTTSKTVVITYPEGDYVKEYSLDLGETWLEYLSPITVDKETVVLTRTVENGKVVSSSSFTITKIDTTEPTIILDIPDEIVLGTEYSLPSSYTVDETKSSGSAICKIGDTEVTTTKDLAIGTYEITCTVTTVTGKVASVSKTLNVIDETIDITLDIPDSILVGSSYNLPTSVTGSSYVCKIGDVEYTNTDTLEVGTYEIICSVTSIGGTTKEVAKQIEVYEETSDDTLEEETENTEEQDTSEEGE